MQYVKRTSYRGYLADTVIYPAPAIGNSTKKKPRALPLTEKQKAANRKWSAAHLQGLIMANFVPYKDLFATFTHPAGTKEEDARKAADNLLDNLRGWCSRHGQKLRYIKITEKQGQWHHHLILSYIPPEVLRKYWEKYSKRVTVSTLDDSQGYFDLVNYLLAEEKESRAGTGKNALRPRRKHEKGWTCSQGLLQPPEAVRVLENPPRKKPTAPAGYQVIEGSRQEYDTRMGRVVTYTSQWIGGGVPKVYQRAQKRLTKRLEKSLAKRKNKERLQC